MISVNIWQYSLHLQDNKLSQKYLLPLKTTALKQMPERKKGNLNGNNILKEG